MSPPLGEEISLASTTPMPVSKQESHKKIIDPAPNNTCTNPHPLHPKSSTGMTVNNVNALLESKQDESKINLGHEEKNADSNLDGEKNDKLDNYQFVIRVSDRHV